MTTEMCRVSRPTARTAENRKDEVREKTAAVALLLPRDHRFPAKSSWVAFDWSL